MIGESAQGRRKRDGAADVVLEEPALNLAYAHVNGNGDEASGDGFRYRGRGLIQLTGRKNYKEFGEKLGLDLVNDPDLALEHFNSIRIAIAFWKTRRGLREAARRGDVGTVTQKITGARGRSRIEKVKKALRSLGVKVR